MKFLVGTTIALLAGLAAPVTPRTSQASALQGTWTLVAADRLLPDGREVRDYGEAPQGRLMVDALGRYSLQIFRSERLRFAKDDKASGSADEFASAVLGSSTHYGVIEVDEQAGMLTFNIDGASFPNWEGTVQRRSYVLTDGLLRWHVPARPDGSVPVSVWRKAN